MLTYLIVIAALMYFILDRKIRLALLPGITLMLAVCCSYCWHNVFRSRSISSIKGIRNPGIGYYLPIIIAVAAFAIVAALVIVIILLLLGRLISKAVFKASGENGSNEKLAKILLLTTSGITSVAGLYQFICAVIFSNINTRKTETVILMSRMLKRLGSSLLAVCVYGLIFLAIGITGIILALTKRSIYKDLSAPVKPSKNITLNIGLILCAIGNLGVGLTAGIGLSIQRRVFFINGYGYPRILCLLFIILMIAGLVVMLIGLAKMKGKVPVVRLVFSVILLIASVCDMLWLIVRIINNLFWMKF